MYQEDACDIRKKAWEQILPSIKEYVKVCIAFKYGEDDFDIEFKDIDFSSCDLVFGYHKIYPPSDKRTTDLHVEGRVSFDDFSDIGYNHSSYYNRYTLEKKEFP